MADGNITSGHVDAVTRASKKLDDRTRRHEFLDRADALAEVAAAGTVEQFGRRLDLDAKRLQSDDGEATVASGRPEWSCATAAWIGSAGTRTSPHRGNDDVSDVHSDPAGVDVPRYDQPEIHRRR